MSVFMLLFSISRFDIQVCNSQVSRTFGGPDVFASYVLEFGFRIIRDTHFIQQGFHGYLVHLETDFPRVISQY